MITFEKIYQLAILSENTVQLLPPTNPSLNDAYLSIKKFVESYSPTPVSELLTKITEDQLKDSKVKKEDVKKVINISNKPIPFLNGMTVNDLFSPNNFVANFYNVINNADKNPETYSKVVESYKRYSNSPSSDNLANLIITVNVSGQQGKITDLANSIITKILSVVPGTAVVSSMLVGSMAAAAPQLNMLTDEFNMLGGNISTVQSSGIMPGQIIAIIGEDSVKYYLVGSVVGVAAIAKGTEMAAQAGETAAELGAKAKEKLQGFLDNLKNSSGNSGLFSTNKGRIPAYNPGANLRGKIGATTPAKY